MTSSDRNEFGNPLENEQVLKNIQAYCPYQNIKEQFYPSFLIHHPLSDGNVGYWESLKYIRKITDLNAQGCNALINFDTKSIHTGTSNILEWKKRIAVSYAFILQNINRF